jgi:hypothetical protein
MTPWNNFFEDDHKKHIENVNNAERLYKEQLRKLKDCEEFVRMTRKNLVDKVRVERSTYDYINWNQAFEELKITDKRKKTPILNFISNKVSEDFLSSRVKIKIDELLYAGMNEYGIIIYFSIDGKRYYIEAPLKDNITGMDSELNYDIGKFCFAEEIDGTWYVQICSYDINDVKEYIAKNVIKNESAGEEKDDTEGID